MVTYEAMSLMFQFGMFLAAATTAACAIIALFFKIVGLYDFGIILRIIKNTECNFKILQINLLHRVQKKQSSYTEYT